MKKSKKRWVLGEVKIVHDSPLFYLFNWESKFINYSGEKLEGKRVRLIAEEL